MDEREKARLRKQEELEAFSKGARGEGRWNQLKGLIGNERQPKEEIREDGLVPTAGNVDMEKIQMMDTNYRMRKEREMQDSMNSQEPQPIYEPSRIEMEQFAAQKGMRPDMSKNESEEQFIKRLKVMMQNER